MSPARALSPALWRACAVQLADGLGGRLHSVLLLVYVTRTGGLGGLSGFAAAGLVGAVLAVLAAGASAPRLSSRGFLAGSTATLLTCRLAQYACVAAGVPLTMNMALQLLSSAAGQAVGNAAKAHAPASDASAAASSQALGWMGVANQLGGVAGAAAAGAIAGWASETVFVVAGIAGAIASTAPMLRFARGSPVGGTPQRLSLRAWRPALRPVLLGAAVLMFISGPMTLSTGLVTDLYHAGWVGPIAAVAVSGNVVATLAMRAVADRCGTHLRASLGWPLIGLVGMLGWAVADQGLVGIALAHICAAGAAHLLATMVEARVLTTVGRGQASAALAASTSVAGGASILSVLATPWLLDTVGFAGLVAVAALGLAVVAVIAAAPLAGRRRPVLGELPATVDATNGAVAVAVAPRAS